MSNFRVSECFNSLQGEGVYVGMPSTFIRFFGCNFTCPGFSRPQVGDIPVNLYVPDNTITSIEDLDGNAFTIGCDSRYAWAKEFSHLQKDFNLQMLMSEVVLPKIRDGIPHLVITGGEPTLRQRPLAEFIVELARTVNQSHRLECITIESNASIRYRKELKDAIKVANEAGISFLFSNSPKLGSSGEPLNKRYNPKVILDQFVAANQVEGVDNIITCKYVVGDRLDCEEALRMHDGYAETVQASEEYCTATDENFDRLFSQFLTPLFMPLGATIEQYNSRATEIANLALEYNARFTPRLHLALYGNKVGT